jgi:glycosyltransferase involved in cell wall biosynthesis
MFQIIIKARNCQDYIDRCIVETKRQLLSDWKMMIVIDKSDDFTFSKAAKYYEKDKIEIHAMQDRMYGMFNIVYGIEQAHPKPEDIICIVDGDDCFSESDALNIVNKYYAIYNCQITYGSFKRMSTGERCPSFRRYDESLPVRAQNWNGSHLKTFRYKLWQKIPKNYLCDSAGNYIRYCDDMAFMFAMIELAGWNNVQQIKELLYMYNDANPENAFETHREECKETEKYLRAMKPLEKISF